MALNIRGLDKVVKVDGKSQTFQIDEVDGVMIIKQTVAGTSEVKATAGIGVEDYQGCQLRFENVNSASGNITKLRLIDKNGVSNDIFTSQNGDFVIKNNMTILGSPSSDTDAVTKAYLDSVVEANVGGAIIGEYKSIWNTSLILLDKWLLCDGRFISKATYAELFALIGNIFGENSTEFKLPDARGRVLAASNASFPIGTLAGNNTQVLTSGQLPTHTHTATTSSVAAYPGTGSQRYIKTGTRADNAVYYQGAGGSGTIAYHPGNNETFAAIDSNSQHSHNTTISSSGNNEAVDMRQPTYYGANLYIRAKV